MCTIQKKKFKTLLKVCGNVSSFSLLVSHTGYATDSMTSRLL